MLSKPPAVWFTMTHSNDGGILEVWRNLQDGFRSKGVCADIVALYPPADAKKADDASAVRHVWSARPRGPWEYFKAMRDLIRLLRDEAPVVVFSAMPVANFMLPLAAACAGRGTRIIVTHHSPLTSIGALARALDRAISSRGLVSNIVCVSKTVADTQPTLTRYRRKSRVIPNALGSDVEALIRGLAPAVGSKRASPRKVVVAAGRLAAEKNYEALLRAAALLPTTIIRIAGRGPEEGQLRALTRTLGAEDRVEFLGFLPRPKVLQLFASGDVFVQPSYFEGHSLALVEAAKLGLPLLVSTAPSQVEGITALDGTQCGVAINPDDVEGLAREISRLCTDDVHYEHLSRLSMKLGAEASFEAMLSSYLELCPEMT